VAQPRVNGKHEIMSFCEESKQILFGILV